MSHSVTVTRTVTTSSNTGTTFYFVSNRGYCCSIPGILKIIETVVGAICLTLIAFYCRGDQYRVSGFVGGKEEALFFLVTFAFLVTTVLLLITCFISVQSAAILPKSTFEYLYHLVAFVFYLAASIALLIEISRRKGYHYYLSNEYGYEAKIAAAALGLVNTVLYLLSFIFSIRTFRVVT